MTTTDAPRDPIGWTVDAFPAAELAQLVQPGDWLTWRAGHPFGGAADVAAGHEVLLERGLRVRGLRLVGLAVRRADEIVLSRCGQDFAGGQSLCQLRDSVLIGEPGGRVTLAAPAELQTELREALRAGDWSAVEAAAAQIRGCAVSRGRSGRTAPQLTWHFNHLATGPGAD